MPINSYSRKKIKSNKLCTIPKIRILISKIKRKGKEKKNSQGVRVLLFLIVVRLAGKI